MSSIHARRRGAVLAVAALAAVGLSVPAANAAGGGAQRTSVVYSSTTTPVKGNLPSYGFEAYSLTRIGDDATLRAAGRHLTSATLTLSSWGCQSGHWSSGDCATASGATFNVPMTFTVYAEDGTTRLASSSATFAVPYRPSASSKCTGGRWYDPSLKQCFNGYATDVTFSFPGVQVPDHVVWDVTYNTSHFGPSPLGESTPCYTSAGGCGYDSLNVAMSTPTDVAYGDTSDTFWVSQATDAGWSVPAGTWGPTPVDSGSYLPAVQLKAAA